MEARSEHDHGQPPVTFTIDGVEYTLDDGRQTARALLSPTGLMAEDHDPAVVGGHSGMEHLNRPGKAGDSKGLETLEPATLE